MNLKLGGKFFTVTNLETARCVAGEGELPFRVGPGFEAPAVDLRDANSFASIDYSDATPRLYLGETVELQACAWTTALRGEPRKVVDLKSFQCPSCAAPMATHTARISGGCLRQLRCDCRYHRPESGDHFQGARRRKGQAEAGAGRPGAAAARLHHRLPAAQDGDRRPDLRVGRIPAVATSRVSAG